MDIQVDQSGKVEYTRVDTVIAFSDGASGAILIPANVKRTCIRTLRQRDWRHQTFIFKIFAAALFLLIQPFISKIDRIVIDVEYPERMGDIKSNLLNYIRRSRSNFAQDQIVFHRIGKQSPAHKKAIEIYRGNVAPERILAAREILQIIGK